MHMDIVGCQKICFDSIESSRKDSAKGGLKCERRAEAGECVKDST